MTHPLEMVAAANRAVVDAQRQVESEARAGDVSDAAWAVLAAAILTLTSAHAAHASAQIIAAAQAQGKVRQ